MRAASTEGARDRASATHAGSPVVVAPRGPRSRTGRAPRIRTLNTREETARVLRVCLRSIDYYIQAGHLRTVRKSRGGLRLRTLIPASEIRRFRRDLAKRARARSR